MFGIPHADYTLAAFEKLASGVLTDEVFQMVTKNDAQEQRECNAQMEQLTPELVHEFVERIVVHERSEPSKKKYYPQAMDIYFIISEYLRKKTGGML